MSCEELFPSFQNLIKDVNHNEVQIAGRFAVEENNRIGGHSVW